MPVMIVFLIVLAIALPLVSIALRGGYGHGAIRDGLDETVERLVARIADLEDDVTVLNESVEELQEELDFTRRLLKPPSDSGKEPGAQ